MGCWAIIQTRCGLLSQEYSYPVSLFVSSSPSLPPSPLPPVMQEHAHTTEPSRTLHFLPCLCIQVCFPSGHVGPLLSSCPDHLPPSIRLCPVSLTGLSLDGVLQWSLPDLPHNQEPTAILSLLSFSLPWVCYP